MITMLPESLNRERFEGNKWSYMVLGLRSVIMCFNDPAGAQVDVTL